jgi:pimeloyl-ACP methyl ester carboxylesterase
MMVRVWYPAILQDGDQKAPYNYNEGLIADMVADGFGIPKAIMRTINKIDGNSWLNAEPLNQRFPVLIFSHGHGGLKTQNTTQMEELASHGYVLFACDHTYDAGISIFPENRVIRNKTDIPKGISDKEKWGIREVQLGYRVGDVQFLLDEMEKGKYLPQSLRNSLELDKIGIFGHSFGGATSVVVSLKDDRIDAALGLDAWFLPIPSTLIKQNMSIPFAHLGQVSWKEKDNYLKLDTLASSNSAQSLRFDVQGSTHYDFSDFSQFSKVSKKYGSGTIASDRIRFIMNTTIRDFFDQYLKQSVSISLNDYKSMYPEIIIKEY